MSEYLIAMAEKAKTPATFNYACEHCNYTDKEDGSGGFSSKLKKAFCPACGKEAKMTGLVMEGTDTLRALSKRRSENERHNRQTMQMAHDYQKQQPPEKEITIKPPTGEERKGPIRMKESTFKSIEEKVAPIAEAIQES